MARNFKTGDWWETRDGCKVMIWETKTPEQTAWLIETGLGGRTLRCAFQGGGMASYPIDGYFIEPAMRKEGNREHENDLMRKCAAPPEFRRPKKRS